MTIGNTIVKHDEYGRSLLTRYQVLNTKIKDKRNVKELLYYTKNETLREKIKNDGGVWVETHTQYPECNYGMVSTHKCLPVYKYIFYPHPGIKYRQYQKEAIVYAYNMNTKGLLIEAMTGAGKTWIIYGIIFGYGVKTVVVCKNKRLQKQMYKDFASVYYKVQMINGCEEKATADIVITTNTTFSMRTWDGYELLIIDEAHNISKKVRDGMNTGKFKRIIGVTATPERAERGLEGMKKYFGNYYKCDEKEIMDTGVVLPVRVYKYRSTYFIDKEDYEKAIIKKGGGLYKEDCHHIYRNILTNNTQRYIYLSRVINYFIDKGKDTFLIFTDRNDHCQKTYEYLVKEGYKNVYMITGEVKNQDEVIEAYKRTGGILVGNVQCLGDGFNVPRIEVCILYYATTNEKVLLQCIGRARRAYGNKQEAIFVDFMDEICFIGMKKKSTDLGRRTRYSIYRKHKFGENCLVV